MIDAAPHANALVHSSAMVDTDVHKQFRKINARSEELIARSRQPPLASNDARNDFLLQAGNQLSCYAISLAFELAASQLLGAPPTGDAAVDGAVRLLGVPITPTTRVAYSGTNVLNYFKQKQKRHLFIDTWCAFEDSLRSVYRVLVPQADQAKDNQRGHASIHKVWTRVATLSASPAMVQAHWDTVDFCASGRNTIHSNTFYHGPPKQLELRPLQFIKLVDGKATDFHTESELPLLIDRLVEAWDAVCDGLASYTQPIPTSAAGLPDPYQ
jgi:hypothetical protein